MTFFEKKTKRAWVGESAIKEFTFESLTAEKSRTVFDRRLFSSNTVYRNAVVEGVRLLLASPGLASGKDPAATAVLEMIRKYEPEFPNTAAAPGGPAAQCVACAGTVMSGELRVCGSTDHAKGRCGGRTAIHYHCLEGGCPLVDVEKRWFCSDCGKSYGWAGGALLPADPSLVPFFGTVDKVRPPSAPGRGDELYHVLFEDGDAEEYFLAELREVMDQYDVFYGPAHNSAIRGQVDGAVIDTGAGRSANSTSLPPRENAFVGARVCKFFAGLLEDQKGTFVGPSNGARHGRDVASSASVIKGGGRQLTPEPAQPRPEKRKLAAVSASAKITEHPQPVIKKKAMAPVDETDGDEVAPSQEKRTAPAASDGRKSFAQESQPGRAQVPPSPQSRPERCQLAANVPIVTFFDQCLAVMARHEAIMERARRRALDSHTVVTQDSVNQLVENMAGDLINAISQRLGTIHRR